MLLDLVIVVAVLLEVLYIAGQGLLGFQGSCGSSCCGIPLVILVDVMVVCLG